MLKGEEGRRLFALKVRDIGRKNNFELMFLPHRHLNRSISTPADRTATVNRGEGQRTATILTAEAKKMEKQLHAEGYSSHPNVVTLANIRLYFGC